MKLLCDHQIFSSFAYSGISRYFCELFSEFDTLGVEWDVSCFFSNNLFLKSLRHYPGFLPERNFRGKNRVLENINLIRTRCALRQGNFDIFHSTYSKPYDLKLLRGKPYIITVHDMTHEKYGAKLPSGVRETAEEKESIARADGIICPSYATRDDLIALYPEAAEKTTVIYHGVRLPEVIPTELFADFRPYFLYVGSRMFYKNFPVAVEAVSKLLSGYRLLCVGGGAFTPAEEALFARFNMSGRVRHCRLDEAELFAAYKNAEALLFPSEAEGFGLPIIEAQSQGCVPVLSDIPCFREIGADKALYFPVNDADGCAEVLKGLLQTSPEFNPAENLKRFDWRTAAEKTLDFYRTFL
jgi:glycosyltransferase involved in cell wall biosynthesis